MNKLSFPQINNLVIRHKSKVHFGKDLELFKSKITDHRLMKELSRATSFSYEKLDGQMIFEMLNKGVSIDEILENRNENPVTENETKTPLIDFGKAMEITSKFTGAGIELTEDVKHIILDLTSASDEDIEAKIAELKLAESSEEETEMKVGITETTVVEITESVTETETDIELTETKVGITETPVVETTDSVTETETDIELTETKLGITETTVVEITESVTETGTDIETSETLKTESVTEPSTVQPEAITPEKKSGESKKSSKK